MILCRSPPPVMFSLSNRNSTLATGSAITVQVNVILSPSCSLNSEAVISTLGAAVCVCVCVCVCVVWVVKKRKGGEERGERESARVGRRLSASSANGQPSIHACSV